MIEINFKPNEYEISVSGHANYAEEGKDIVCAAVSMLFYTLAASLDEKICTCEKTIDKGSSTIKCIPQEKYVQNIALIFWTIMNGFELLAESYQDHVKLTIS